MLKVLIAEDDPMIAHMVEETLLGHGYKVCGIAHSVAEALVLGRRHKPDLAVIDLRLADEGWLGTDIGARLSGDGTVGILYASGNITPAILAVIDGHACLAKPYSAADLLRSLEIVVEIVATGTASQPFPRGLQMRPSAKVALRESWFG
jgi:DNA-binding response OmpR family regulator